MTRVRGVLEASEQASEGLSWCMYVSVCVCRCVSLLGRQGGRGGSQGEGEVGGGRGWGVGFLRGGIGVTWLSLAGGRPRGPALVSEGSFKEWAALQVSESSGGQSKDEESHYCK